MALLVPEHRARIEPLIVDGCMTLVRQYGTDGKSHLGYFGMVPREERFSEPSRDEMMRGKKGADLKTAVTAQFPELAGRAGEITSQKSANELIAQVPHIVQVLGGGTPLTATPTAFVRVLGKGSIRRYRSFFSRFGIKVLVVADLDVVLDGFAQLDPDAALTATRENLLAAIDAATAAAPAPQPNADDVRQAQAQLNVRQLWNQVRAARAVFDADPTKLPELSDAVDAFFAWERKSIRYEQLRQPTVAPVSAAKATLLSDLRNRGIFLWHNGAIDDYYPAAVTGPDKPSRAQSFRNAVVSREALAACCPTITCPATNQTKPEFDFLAGFLAG